MILVRESVKSEVLDASLENVVTIEEEIPSADSSGFVPGWPPSRDIPVSEVVISILHHRSRTQTM